MSYRLKGWLSLLILIVFGCILVYRSIQSKRNTEYLERTGKTIKSTKLGKEFYNKLPNILKTADMTALWWVIQEEIIENKKTPDDLILSVLETVKTVLSETKSYILETNKIKCPSCETGYIIQKNGKFGLYWSCLECKKNYKDDKGKPDFTEKNPVEKSEKKCPKDGGDLYKNRGQWGDYYRCTLCKSTYKDKNGEPDLSEKKHLKNLIINANVELIL